MNQVENYLAKLYAYRSYRAHHKHLLGRIARLKAQNKFAENPAKPKADLAINPLFIKQDLQWFDYFYCLNNIASDTYMPLRPFYLYIEPILNHRLMVSTLKDKNFYELYFSTTLHPKVLLRKINNFLYDGQYCLVKNPKEALHLLSGNEKLILKPALDSGGGTEIILFEENNGSLVSGEQILDQNYLTGYKHDFVIQEVVRQHDYYRKFNPSSNNTVRILVYRSVKDDSLNILHILLRVGRKGHFLDHDNYGGISIYVDQLGKLANLAYDRDGNATETYNGLKFSDLGSVPHLNALRDAALSIASKVYYARLLALDFTISETGEALLLDLNCWRNGISHYQIHSGTLFGPFTKEVVEYCHAHPGFNIIRIPMVY